MTACLSSRRIPRRQLTIIYIPFGKGRHPAALHIGDCFSYTLAVATGHALLFKGNDFSLTDVRSALPATPPPAG